MASNVGPKFTYRAQEAKTNKVKTPAAFQSCGIEGSSWLRNEPGLWGVELIISHKPRLG